MLGLGENCSNFNPLVSHSTLNRSSKLDRANIGVEHNISLIELKAL